MFTVGDTIYHIESHKYGIYKGKNKHTYFVTFKDEYGYIETLCVNSNQIKKG